MSKNKQKPDINKVNRKRLAEALAELREIPSATFAEAEVCMDELANALRDAFWGTKTKAFGNRTPALHDVVDKLETAFGLDEAAVDAAYELKNHIEDTYQEDEDEDVFYDVGEAAKELADLLEKFIA